MADRKVRKFPPKCMHVCCNIMAKGGVRNIKARGPNVSRPIVGGGWEIIVLD